MSSSRRRKGRDTRQSAETITNRVPLRVVDGLQNAEGNVEDWRFRDEDRPAIDRLMRESGVSPETPQYFPLRTSLEIFVGVTRAFRRRQETAIAQGVAEGKDVNAPEVLAWRTGNRDAVLKFLSDVDEWVTVFGATKASAARVKRIMRQYADKELLGESKKPDYTGAHHPPSEAAVTRQLQMGDAATLQKINSLADDLDVPEGERPAFSQWVLSFPAGGRETTDRATAKPRPKNPAKNAGVQAEPAKPAAIEWPTEKWKGSPEHLSRKQRAIFPFLRRVWKPFIDDTGAVVTRQMLKERDADAGIALRNALRSCAMPDDIRIIPTRELKNTVGNQPMVLHMMQHG